MKWWLWSILWGWNLPLIDMEGMQHCGTSSSAFSRGRFWTDLHNKTSLVNSCPLIPVKVVISNLQQTLFSLFLDFYQPKAFPKPHPLWLPSSLKLRLGYQTAHRRGWGRDTSLSTTTATLPGTETPNNWRGWCVKEQCKRAQWCIWSVPLEYFTNGSRQNKNGILGVMHLKLVYLLIQDFLRQQMSVQGW